MPLDGAYGRIDTESVTEKNAVMLHTPEPGYTKEPYNNWSQSIVGDFSGKTIQLSGYIQTVDAKNAALWLQCWRKQPIQVIEVFSTVQEYPMAGSQPWMKVTVRAEIPDGTDFLVVRCVLRGTGTAWFDELTLYEVEDTEIINLESAEDEVKTNIVIAEPQEISENDSKSQEPQTQDLDILTPLLKQLESELLELRNVNALLAESFKYIQAENENLQKELSNIKNQIQSLPINQRETGNTIPEIKRSPHETGISETPDSEVSPNGDSTHTIPPLLPHGIVWKETP